MSKQLKVYVAGPYTAPDAASIEANTKRAIDAGLRILKKGHIPFIPHLTHYVDLRARELGLEVSWNEYISWDLQWLDQCDALLFLGSSRGADIELQRARNLGLQIYLSLDDLPAASESSLAGPRF